MQEHHARLDQSLEALQLIKLRLGGHAAACNGLDAAIHFVKKMERPVMRTEDVLELLGRIRLAADLKVAP